MRVVRWGSGGIFGFWLVRSAVTVPVVEAEWSEEEKASVSFSGNGDFCGILPCVLGAFRFSSSELLSKRGSHLKLKSYELRADA